MAFLTVEHIAGPGPSTAPVALLLHGFTQNRRCWGGFAQSLGKTNSVWGMDLPGHGTSGGNEASFAESGELVASTVASMPFGVDTLLGYSMGGRMALATALDAPDLFNRLVLIGATAGLRSPKERAERLISDGRLAERLRAEGPQAFLDFWLASPLFRGLTAEQQGRAERLALWGRGVAETLELRGTGSMPPLWDRLGGLAMPTTILAGEKDQKFSDYGQAMAAAIGSNAIYRSVLRAGHACHLEEPTDTAKTFL